MEILALILARGGSKGLPRKNIVKLCGKPLIAYAIEQARASKYINRIIVSTDDEEIAQISLKYGAEVPFIRPIEFAQDFSPDIDVFYHALTWLRDNERYVPDIVLNHRTVCPIRRVEIIDEAIELFINTPKADSLRSVCVAKESPYKMWRINDCGFMQPIMGDCEGIWANYGSEFYNLPRQDLPVAYWQFGYVDMVRGHVILRDKKMSGCNILPFIVDEEWVDIDYEEDLIEAERLLKKGPEKIKRGYST